MRGLRTASRTATTLIMGCGLVVAAGCSLRVRTELEASCSLDTRAVAIDPSPGDYVQDSAAHLGGQECRASHRLVGPARWNAAERRGAHDPVTPAPASAPRRPQS